MPNRLATETSPYLLQHADNPVDWWPWGEAALAEARTTGRPILLSVGYAACHWCHVMAHESFEDEATAAVMNRLYVNIKVDREERPDVDQIYMAALHALGEQGGWPLTMFLTPAGEPFWGGTYFPPVARYGRPGFVQVLEAVARTHAEDRDRVAHNATALRRHLEGLNAPAERAGALTPALLDEACRRLAGILDPVNGGLQGAPKFPQPTLLALLFRQAARTGEDALAAAACFALDRMSQGGLYDHVGGGYARYSVDERWLVPHFEKMLSDNGQLLSLLARAHRLTGETLFRARIVETVAWLMSTMRLPGGAFAASLDADTEGEEGLTYVWTEADIDGILEADSALFKSIYDVTPAGNWEGRTILNRLASGGLRDPETEAQLADAIDRLKAERDRRPQPGRDDKVLADWNGLVIRGLVDAGLALGRPDWIAEAADAYRFVLRDMADGDGRIAHAARAGRLVRPGFASDLAAMAVAAVALHQATFDPAYLADAARLLDALDRHHRVGDGLFYLSADDATDLLVRPKPVHDEATPNHHGLAAEASIDLHLLTGEARHLDRVDGILDAMAGPALTNVLGAASVLGAFARRLAMATVVVVGPDGAARATLVEAARAALPDAVLFASESTADLPPGHPAAGKDAGAAGAAAFVCRGGTCSLPVTRAADLTALAAG